MKQPNYDQLCVLRGVTDELDELKPLLEQEFNIRVLMAEAFETLPDNSGPGGRREVLFWVHNDDVMRFAIPRLQYGISWWEDYLSNNRALIPSRVRNAYPKTW